MRVDLRLHHPAGDSKWRMYEVKSTAVCKSHYRPPWHARGHSCLEAPIEGSDGASGESLFFCTACGSVGHPGARWGRSALASDCPGARTGRRERQLAWISRRKHPSRLDGRVG